MQHEPIRELERCRKAGDAKRSGQRAVLLGEGGEDLVEGSTAEEAFVIRVDVVKSERKIGGAEVGAGKKRMAEGAAGRRERKRTRDESARLRGDR